MQVSGILIPKWRLLIVFKMQGFIFKMFWILVNKHRVRSVNNFWRLGNLLMD